MDVKLIAFLVGVIFAAGGVYWRVIICEREIMRIKDNHLFHINQQLSRIEKTLARVVEHLGISE